MQTITAKLPTLARVLLGLAFFVFGLNGFLGFLPMPAHPAEAGAFLGALGATGYMFPLIKGTEVVVGALLLANRFVPLALALLAPITVNIVLFHAVLEPPQTLVMPAVLLGAHLLLAWTHRAAYRPMLQARHAPAVSETPAAPGALARA